MKIKKKLRELEGKSQNDINSNFSCDMTKQYSSNGKKKTNKKVLLRGGKRDLTPTADQPDPTLINLHNH